MAPRVIAVISGGQTGADQGALIGARRVGILTGGWMPRGFRTEDGPDPELARIFGLKEHTSPKYPLRTYCNVRESDATLWIGHKDGMGFRCTRNATLDEHKPMLCNPKMEDFLRWIVERHVNVLNVAGPRRSLDAKAHDRARDFIVEAFR